MLFFQNHIPTFKRQVGLLAVAVLLLFPIRSQAINPRATGFRAAVVKVDVTPEGHQMLLGYGARRSTGVLDRIYHRITVLDDGKTQFVLVSSDFAVVSPSEYDKVAAKLKSQLGIDPVNFWWTLTHTHSAPEVGPPGLPALFMGERYQHKFDSDYTDVVEKKLIDGVAEARKKLEPARLGVGWGMAQANINRRAKGVDGKAFLGMDPDGPVDRRIGMLRLDKADGTPMALISNYAIHGTVMGGENLLISGDAPGVVAQYVEEQLGIPLLFINGAAGNIAPIYSQYANHKIGRLHQFKTLLGDKIIAANQSIKATTAEVSLKTASLVVETPRKPELGWVDDLKDYTRTTKAGVNMIKLPVRFLQINDDIAIWSAPLELFCEISNEVRDRSPFPYTFYFGYGNGWLGYLLTAEEITHGGYEITVSPYTPAAAKDLTESVVNYLQGHPASSRKP
ncbi:neutral/alkaline non-lysosomal ceramidase N-terminal domain-containing protein [Larkinella sp. C7]|uniref:neutral/alkaline non-lysosomal ceramidase N-terminal domain-containing protein n=1 Tax=Larkinella sp. C7 TaxID=2576607 RepID=UPI001111375A|nr:neutral/alkaline non-lysosomal ceramidase N-terminal domain-containing protein [Larkinella sp. C7]